jgi:hypothetical protein
MKRILNAFLEFLEAWGEHRYKTSQRRGYGMY